jgi:hypothetical protein
VASSVIWQETGSPDNILTEAGDNLVQEDHSVAGAVGTIQVRFLRSRLRKTYQMTRTGPA